MVIFINLGLDLNVHNGIREQLSIELLLALFPEGLDQRGVFLEAADPNDRLEHLDEALDNEALDHLAVLGLVAEDLVQLVDDLVTELLDEVVPARHLGEASLVDPGGMVTSEVKPGIGNAETSSSDEAGSCASL